MPCYLKKTHQLAGNEKAYLLECDSTQDKVNLLSQLTLHDAQQPEVRRLAELVTMRAETPDEGAELLHAAPSSCTHLCAMASRLRQSRSKHSAQRFGR